MITLHDVQQGTPEWLELRADLYTGHNAHKLLTTAGQIKVISGVASAYALNELTNSFKGNYWTKRGHILEDEAVDLYKIIQKADDVLRPGFVTNSQFPTCGYSPDALRPNRTIEVKAFDDPKHLKLFNDDIPFTVLAQVHFGMLICDKDLCDLVIYNPNLDAQHAFKVITIKSRRSIRTNFKNKLAGKETALHV